MQGFNRGQGCTKRRILNGLCFEIQKRLLAVRGKVNDYLRGALVICLYIFIKIIY
ncbi:MAG: hypothetical protein U9Q89_04185 [Thermodesulfobacteriota bacterium]|nr:hypothetical protein [Thermodesulfobacteriota bacterium]